MKSEHEVTALPGEKFILNVSKKDAMMPFKFDTEKQHKDERLLEGLRPQDVKVVYKQVKYDTIDEVVCALQCEQSNRTLLIQALAGTGKTCYTHYVVSAWRQNTAFTEFDVVLGIAIKDVDVNAPILEMLGSGQYGLNYLNESTIVTLQQMLSVPQTASKILIIVDGIDEKDIPEQSEMLKIITGQAGQLFSDISVVLTCRPETPIMSHIRDIPIYKVTIQGTTREGVYQYLQKKVTCQEQNIEKEVDNLVKQCEESMVNFDLLTVPLYLTLIVHVFNEEWAKYLTFRHFVIPNTVTKLFNSFITVLLRNWLYKLNRQNEADNLKFDRSPIDNTSAVPCDIQHKLLIIGELCYNSLLENCYTFTEHDLKKYHLDTGDTLLSGMFCSTENLVTNLYFRHKQLQEYMAALFLSDKQFKNTSFTDTLHKAQTSEKKESLISILNKMQMVLPFVFGLEPTFAVEILKNLNNELLC